MISDDFDLAGLASFLKGHLAQNGAPTGYLRGKSVMRDAVVRQMGKSELEAEELIDTLELQGFLHFLGNPQERSEAESHWDIKGHSAG